MEMVMGDEGTARERRTAVEMTKKGMEMKRLVGGADGRLVDDA